MRIDDETEYALRYLEVKASIKRSDNRIVVKQNVLRIVCSALREATELPDPERNDPRDE